MTNGASILASLGLDRTSFRGSIARAEAEAQGLARNLKGALGTVGIGLSAAGTAAFMADIVEKAHEIHHESERFGIDAQQLQLIGNAAQQEGINLESTARAMSHLVFAEAEAAGGSAKMSDAFDTLRINLQTFRSLSPEQKMLALADAIKAAGLNTDTYNAAAELLGKRFGTELIPVLLKGGDAIKQISAQMGVMDTETVNSLDHAYTVWKTFWNQIVVVSADALTGILHAIKELQIGAEVIWTRMKNDAVGAWGYIKGGLQSTASGMGWHGDTEAWKKSQEEKQADLKKLGAIQEQLGREASEIDKRTAKDFKSLITGVSAAVQAKPGRPAGPGGLGEIGDWQTAAPKTAAGAQLPWGSIESREAERQGHFGQSSQNTFNTGWAGGNQGQNPFNTIGMGDKKGQGQFEKALKPAERKLDAIERNTEQQFVNK